MYDPTLPANNSPNSSAEMRAQLTGLKALIDAIDTITSAVIDSVTTGNPGDAAVVSLNVVDGTLRFDFTLPRGFNGDPGPTGEVSTSDLTTAINGTSSNSNGVTTLGSGASLAYDQTQMQEVINKIDELINALRR